LDARRGVNKRAYLQFFAPRYITPSAALIRRTAEAASEMKTVGHTRFQPGLFERGLPGGRRSLPQPRRPAEGFDPLLLPTWNERPFTTVQIDCECAIRDGRESSNGNRLEMNN
jgi:hypothetical protein